MKSPKSSDVHPLQFKRLRGWLRGEMSIFVMVRPYLISINHLNMKNLLLLILFIAFILQGCEGELVYNKENLYIKNGGENGMTYKGELYSGKYIRYWETSDGTLSKVEEKGSYKNGQKVGVWLEYNEMSNLFYKGSYLNGKKKGVWEAYYENGQLYSRGSYLNGKEEGVWEGYHDNGKLFSIGSYINGEKNGVWDYYHINGQTISKYSYLNGEKNGFWGNYSENVSVAGTETW